jgi:hypothetical protein
MSNTPETWTRYPRSTDPAKDAAALVARVESMKNCVGLLAAILEFDAGGRECSPVKYATDLCLAYTLEHQDWIAQRGVEAVRKAVMPEDKS